MQQDLAWVLAFLRLEIFAKRCVTNVTWNNRVISAVMSRIMMHKCIFCRNTKKLQKYKTIWRVQVITRLVIQGQAALYGHWTGHSGNARVPATAGEIADKSGIRNVHNAILHCNRYMDNMYTSKKSD